MSKEFIEDRSFSGIDFSEIRLSTGDYENCHFKNCLLAGINLSGSGFTGCTFEQCDLSNVRLGNTALREVSFRNCKLLGLHFEDCNPFLFSAGFESCHLDLSSFYGRSLKGTIFSDCSLREVDFVEADLAGAVFDRSELTGAVFEHSVLEKADFRSARGYMINPQSNRLRGAKFSMDGLPGLLVHHEIIIE